MKTAGTLLLAAGVLSLGPAAPVAAQEPTCRFICDVAWKVEPTVTIENLAGRHRVVTSAGVTRRVNRERVFETVLAVDMTSRLPRLGFTVEASAAPFSDDNSAELELETNLHWLTASMSNGWLTSHVDIVDQFSPIERPGRSRPYTHKLDFELDTALHPFARLPETRWLHGLELEASLDYLATGIPKAGDVWDDELFLEDASHWSLSFVVILPIAPF